MPARALRGLYTNKFSLRDSEENCQNVDNFLLWVYDIGVRKILRKGGLKMSKVSWLVVCLICYAAAGLILFLSALFGFIRPVSIPSSWGQRITIGNGNRVKERIEDLIYLLIILLDVVPFLLFLTL